MKHKEWSLLIGRYQCLPPHEGHTGLVYKLLENGKNVCIGLRKEDGGEKNPYSQKKRAKAFKKIFKNEIKEGRVCIINIPDIVDVCYGRTPGWSITEIKLDKKTEAISGTKKRKESNIKGGK